MHLTRQCIGYSIVLLLTKSSISLRGSDTELIGGKTFSGRSCCLPPFAQEFTPLYSHYVNPDSDHRSHHRFPFSAYQTHSANCSALADSRPVRQLLFTFNFYCYKIYTWIWKLKIFIYHLVHSGLHVYCLNLAMYAVYGPIKAVKLLRFFIHFVFSCYWCAVPPLRFYVLLITK